MGQKVIQLPPLFHQGFVQTSHEGNFPFKIVLEIRGLGGLAAVVWPILSIGRYSPGAQAKLDRYFALQPTSLSTRENAAEEIS